VPRVWRQNMASPGTTSRASPYEDQLAGEPVFAFYSSADLYFAIGQTPTRSTARGVS
jgi:hypothetical protein